MTANPRIPNPTGYCRFCKHHVILIDRYLRKHKDLAGEVCKGSDKLPSTSPKDKEALDQIVRERYIPLIKEASLLPAGLESALVVKRIHKECPAAMCTKEWVEWMMNGLAEYIANMPEEDSAIFDKEDSCEN